MSPKQRTELRRKKKDTPNKRNLLQRERQVQENLSLLKQLSQESAQADA
ncbi:MAG: hypothetical protein ACO4AU_09620 [bacterium]|jgi:hypothetical protein